MRFSIVITFHNSVSVLDDCLSSVVNQTFDDYEVIVIESASTDGSRQLAERYAQEFPEKIKLFTLDDNISVIAGRFLGAEVATGEILLWVDADDTLRFDALEKLDTAFKSNDVDMVVYDGTYESDYSTRKVGDKSLLAYLGGVCHYQPLCIRLSEERPVSLFIPSEKLSRESYSRLSISTIFTTLP